MRKRKIVLDSCVPIDLEIKKIELLDRCLDSLTEDEIYISSVNFDEIKDSKIQKLLRSYNVKIIPSDQSKFDNFFSEIKSLELGLSINDSHVLFLAYTQEADFVVTSDDNVFDKTNKYKKNKNLTFMRPMTTVLLLDYIYKKGKMNFKIFFEKSLNLFKYKEIENIFMNHLIKENLNVTREEKNEIIKNYSGFTMKKFQDYQGPLIVELRRLKLEG